MTKEYGVYTASTSKLVHNQLTGPHARWWNQVLHKMPYSWSVQKVHVRNPSFSSSANQRSPYDGYGDMVDCVGPLQNTTIVSIPSHLRPRTMDVLLSIQSLRVPVTVHPKHPSRTPRSHCLHKPMLVSYANASRHRNLIPTVRGIYCDTHAGRSKDFRCIPENSRGSRP